MTKVKKKFYCCGNGNHQKLYESMVTLSEIAFAIPQDIKGAFLDACYLYHDHFNNGSCNIHERSLEIVADANISKSSKFLAALELFVKLNEHVEEETCSCCGHQIECEPIETDEWNDDFETMMDAVIVWAAKKSGIKGKVKA